MRIPRSIQLFDLYGFVHSYWRCHNKEFYLRDPKIKSLYLNSRIEALKSQNKDNSLKIYAYTVMDNHYHDLMGFLNGCLKLSNFFRLAHSFFGVRFNKLFKRSGKVAEGRPKTTLIENFEHLIKAQFYIEANPIRAGKCTERQLRGYEFSSYRFYAFGISDKFSEILLTVPDWYVALGDTAQKRQAKYRGLFNEYLKNSMSREEFYSPFIGSPLWKLARIEKVKEMIKAKKLLKTSPG